MHARRCGVISALSKQRRRGVPAAARAHELWLELQASGLADRDAAAITIGAQPQSAPARARHLGMSVFLSFRAWTV